MALKLDYFKAQHWQEVCRWRGADMPPPPHALCAVEDGVLVAALSWELGDGLLVVMTALDVHPALPEDDRAQAASYVSRVALQLGKMLGKEPRWLGPPLQKNAPQKPGVASGGRDGTSTKRDEGDVTQESPEVKGSEELDW